MVLRFNHTSILDHKVNTLIDKMMNDDGVWREKNKQYTAPIMP